MDQSGVEVGCHLNAGAVVESYGFVRLGSVGTGVGIGNGVVGLAETVCGVAAPDVGEGFVEIGARGFE